MNLLLQSQLTRKVPVPMGESSEDVIREEEIAKVSILTYLKSDQ